MIAYDYSGYGRSEGTPSEQEMYSDIEHVGCFANFLNIVSKDIILFGHSLGSAPTVHLATKYSDIRAVILMAPIASGIKLVSPHCEIKELEKVDVFCNLKKVSDISCPIMLIHGKKDEVIPVEQSMEMTKYMQSPFEWYPADGDHNNIVTKYRLKFYQKCMSFFQYICYQKVRINCSPGTTRKKLYNPDIVRAESVDESERVSQFNGEQCCSVVDNYMDGPFTECCTKKVNKHFKKLKTKSTVEDSYSRDEKDYYCLSNRSFSGVSRGYSKVSLVCLKNSRDIEEQCKKVMVNMSK